jgi:hypothetical protein
MPRIRSNVVIRCILHHVRNLSLQDPTVGVIDEQMLAVVLAPNRVAPCTSTSGTCGAASSVRRARWRCSSFPRPSRQSRTGLRDPRHRGSRASAAPWHAPTSSAQIAGSRCELTLPHDYASSLRGLHRRCGSANRRPTSGRMGADHRRRTHWRLQPGVCARRMARWGNRTGCRSSFCRYEPSNASSGVHGERRIGGHHRRVDPPVHGNRLRTASGVRVRRR